MDVAGECLLYYEYMTRVYLADALTEERSALRLVLLDLNMEVVGEAADWKTTLAQAPVSRTDMLLIDWGLLLAPRPVGLWKNSERPARPRWSLSSSAIWTPVSKPPSLPAPTRLSVKVKRPSVWPSACGQLPPAFVLDDATCWLNERLEIRRTQRCPERRRKPGQHFQRIRRIKP